MICGNAGGQQRPNGEAAVAQPNQVIQRAPPRRVGGVRGRPVRNRLAAAQPQDDSGNQSIISLAFLHAVHYNNSKHYMGENNAEN